ncbi:MAG: D-aminoacylase [Planctomycetota bacterium]|nr:D-aminoacylase [Planctomycetota bacterium]
MRNSLTLLFITALSVLVSALQAQPKPVDAKIDADILLEQGTIHDGSGGEPSVGDIAILGDKIVAVGKFAVGKVGQRIDCRGLVIAPGCIDLHNHSDRQIVATGTRANINYLTQGCTTIVTGNCGSGPVDVAKYYDQIDAAGAGTNVAHLLAQGSLRSRVMETVRREPTDAELAQMLELANKAMQEGAWGMSTGLIYVPSSYANTDELIALAKVVSQHGGIYASHIRNENTELLAAIDEAIKIGRQAKLPVHISHFKSSGRNCWGLVRVAAKLIEKAREQGQVVTADQYPYIASSTSLDATVIPAWARAGGRKQLIQRLDDPTEGKRIRDLMQESLTRKDNGAAVMIARCTYNPSWVGLSVADIAKQLKKSPLEVSELIARNGGAAIVNFSMSEEDVRHIMQIPWVATASDGRAYLPGPDQPHPRSYGTFARKLGHYAIRERVLPLAKAIRSSTGLPAEILGMKNRGLLKAGYFADVIVFAEANFIDQAKFKDPHQYSTGLSYVFVNGTPALHRGHVTGALAGRALRHESARAAK